MILKIKYYYYERKVKKCRKFNCNVTVVRFSYGDRQTISLLLRKLKQQAKEKLKSRKPEMVESLRKLGDFVVDLKWDFSSWIPLVSRMLPSDICKISKKGKSTFIKESNCSYSIDSLLIFRLHKLVMHFAFIIKVVDRSESHICRTFDTIRR